MTGRGVPAARTAGEGMHVQAALVASRWYAAVMDGLVAGAQYACAEAGTPAPALVRVPGSFELPLGAATAIDRGYDAVIALGVVLRGDTPHFDYVCRGATDQLARLAVDHRIPVGFGLLTCDTEEQSRARSGPHEPSGTGPAFGPGNKGYEAATAAIEMALLGQVSGTA